MGKGRERGGSLEDEPFWHSRLSHPPLQNDFRDGSLNLNGEEDWSTPTYTYLLAFDLQYFIILEGGKNH